ncbi:phytase [Sphingosinicella sp. LHD-64]|uniref:phytase n=1 Tax=Sphingosinicella sp. LHD-64 TaxID=3072139 RepID=UPI002810410A|nr:phytase [Sphingosinicella sp. LHD-64]MDQ8756328.1 phytase [Sphingosinicella sp. LHD-64]
MRFHATTAVAALLALSGCATTTEVAIPQGSAARGDPARPVPAAVETVVTTDPAVDADDPAFWADPRDPSRAVIFGTDKSDGLYVHDMDGSVRQFFGDGPMNNVDLRPGFVVDGRDYVLVAATDRRRFGIMTYLLDPDTLETRPYGFIPATDMGEPYGFCMARAGEAFFLIPNNKEGEVRQYRVTAGAGGPSATLERTMRVGSQPEGCVADDEAGQLYVGEEDVGIWRFALSGETAGTRIAMADGRRLTADVEGLAIMRDRGAKYLIASSQGDSTYPVWRITAEGYDYVGRFAIEGGAIDSVTSTDGVDAWSGPIGPFPEGAIGVHDTDDGQGQQNYKIVDWREIRRALGL